MPNPRTWTTVAKFLFAAVLVGVVVVLLMKFLSDDDDRPPIIVRNGSVILDGGDSQDPKRRWKDWRRDTPPALRWRPVHPDGASVTKFSVTVAGSPQPSTCATGAIEGTDVFIDYTADSSGTTTRLHLYRDPIFTSPGTSKWEPVIDAPASLTIVPGTSSDPPQLVYNPGDGYISAVTVGTTTCTFTHPATDAERRAVRVTIKPKK